MTRSSRVASMTGLLMALLATVLPADESAKKAEAVKPPWQRMLQGENKKKADEQEKQLAQLQKAGKFEEALKVAEALAELRQKVQGRDHWQAVDAQWTVTALRRVVKQEKETRKQYATIEELARQASALESKGRYREAQPLQEKILSIRRKVLGDEHPNTATCYNNLAANQHAQGKYKEAEVGFRKALAIRSKVLGEEHPHTGASYNDLAYNQHAQGKYREAEEGHRKALAICRKVLGEEHPDTATSYNNLAQNQNAQGKYRDAEESFRKALAIFGKVLGEEHPDTATSYNNLAYNQNAQGKYREAEESFRKTLAINRKVLGEEHPDTAGSYGSLAYNQHAQGKYREAEEGYRQALAICRKVLGEEHPETAKSYNNLAVNQNAQGKYAQAEEGYRQALAICRKLLGEEHPETATSYNNLAQNQKAQGKYAQAEEGYRQALAICRKVLGEEHPDTAISYNNLAGNQNAQGKYAEAEQGLSKALVICRKLLGEDHTRTATTYNNLALNQNAQGKYKEAEEGFRKALAIRRKVLGEEHPSTAQSYNSLALNQKFQGKYAQAEEGYHKALSIYRKVLGEEHPDTALSYNNLAHNQYVQGEYADAEELWGRAAESFAKVRLRIAATGLERATKTSEQSPLPSLAAVLARNGKPADAWQRFEESLARGTWDDLNARLRRTLAEQAKQTQLAGHIERLDELIKSLAPAKTATPQQSKRREELLTQLRQAQDDLADFTHQLEQKYGPVAGQVLERKTIQAALPEDTALIGWLDIPGKAKAADPNGEHWAILLRSSGAPVWVRLRGSGDNDAWNDDDIRLPGKLRTVLQSPRGIWQPLAERLRQQRLQPLLRHLKGVRHLIVLPSTALAGVPIEVIADGYRVSYAHSGSMYAHLREQSAPSGKGLFALADPVFEAPILAEKPQPLPPNGVLLTVVVPGSNAAKAGLRPNDVLLRYNGTALAGPKDFKPLPPSDDPDKRVPVIVWREGKTRQQPIFVPPGKLGIVIADKPAPEALAEQRRLDRRLASRSGEDGNWNRLPGTRVEVASLQRLFDNQPSRVLLDSDSSEQRLDELAQAGELGKYCYLHLATHGEVNDTFPLRSAVILARDRLPDDKQRTELLLSGQPIADGRLTAEEVLRRWNLHCDLVTLSACQTALGKYERGEGFVGFAQALVLCGSRSVCLSLWKVDDTATALLMERFYQNLLGRREGLKAPLSKAAALAEAKAWLRNLSREEAVKQAATLSQGVSRGKGKRVKPVLEVPAAGETATKDCPFASPYYWAAFVLVGHAD